MQVWRSLLKVPGEVIQYYYLLLLLIIIIIIPLLLLLLLIIIIITYYYDYYYNNRSSENWPLAKMIMYVGQSLFSGLFSAGGKTYIGISKARARYEKWTKVLL